MVKVELGKPFNLFSIGRFQNVDAAGVFEALPDKNGFLLAIYMADMSPLEARIISKEKISVRVFRDTPYLVYPVFRFGDSPIIIEMEFDPTLYGDDRAMQLVIDNNLVLVVGIDSRTNIVRALRLCNFPRRLRDMLITAWGMAFEMLGYSNLYKKWTIDLKSRYSPYEIWERGIYAGKFGEK